MLSVLGAVIVFSYLKISRHHEAFPLPPPPSRVSRAFGKTRASVNAGQRVFLIVGNSKQVVIVQELNSKANRVKVMQQHFSGEVKSFNVTLTLIYPLD